MAHPRDDQVHPLQTVVRLKKTGEFAVIRNYTYQFNGRGFLNYLGVIEGRGEHLWALYHDEVELEAP